MNFKISQVIITVFILSCLMSQASRSFAQTTMPDQRWTKAIQRMTSYVAKRYKSHLHGNKFIHETVINNKEDLFLASKKAKEEALADMQHPKLLDPTFVTVFKGKSSSEVSADFSKLQGETLEAFYQNLETNLSKLDEVRIVTRNSEEMRAADMETDYQLNSLVNQGTAVTLGKKVGAKKIFFIRLISKPFESDLIISVKVIDVETLVILPHFVLHMSVAFPGGANDLASFIEEHHEYVSKIREEEQSKRDLEKKERALSLQKEIKDIFDGMIVFTPTKQREITEIITEASEHFETLDGPDGAPMKLIPAGEFILGHDEVEHAYHPQTVHLSSFYISQYPITNLQMADFLNAYLETHGEFVGPNGDRFLYPNEYSIGAVTHHKKLGLIGGLLWEFFGVKTERKYYSESSKLDLYAMWGANWQTANTYCRYYGMKLPSEFQWEKAAKGKSNKKYVWGNDPSLLSLFIQKDNVIEKYPSYWNRHRQVGSMPSTKSYYQIHDMTTLVPEWTDTWEHEYISSYSKEKIKEANVFSSNPKGPDNGEYKIVRGNTNYMDWHEDSKDELRLTPVSERYASFLSMHSRNGFRCVLEANK